MSDFANRLRRLRREDGPGRGPSTPAAAAEPEAPETPEANVANGAEAPGTHAPPGPAAPVDAGPARALDPLERAARGDLPSWLKRRIDKAPRPEPTVAVLPRSVGDPQRLERRGGHAERADRCPAADVHGNLRLDSALGADPAVLARLARDPALERLDPERALYLDIETTGLSGGAGTYPFLVALAGFEPGAGGELEVVVWQGFMGGPGDERSMLAAVAERVAAAGSIVTFFGKSFDRHRLEDKMRHHGVTPPFADLPHLDLYHPLRRLYGEALPNGKLQTCERALLGFEREDDLSGAFAPAAWFDYQAGRPHLLEHVFRHNYLDVLSLCSLTGHLGRAEGSVPVALEPGRLEFARLRGLARGAAASCERGAQVGWLERALERVDAAALDPERCAALAQELRLERADALRLGRELVAAKEAYGELGETEGTAGALAALELAKLELRRRSRADRVRVEDALARARKALPTADPGPLRARLERETAALAERCGPG